MKASGKSNYARSGQENLQIQVIQSANQDLDGARLIAPSRTCGVTFELSGEGEKEYKDGFDAALDGAYPLENPFLDLENRTVYSVDMVRLDFWHDQQQILIDAIDKNMVFATCDSFTSNRIGTYRFMWTFSYADGEDGGYSIERDGKEIVDGDKSVVLKCGYGVIQKGGKQNAKGFVEFNPNKCERNARRFIELLYGIGCIFVLNRYDLAIDVPIGRPFVRVLRDRRKYEYVLSSKGGATEYLGQRNSPGRVKVYDKAGEQGLETSLTRIELTCAADWDIAKIHEHLPVCNDYSRYAGKGVLLAICTIIADMLIDVGEDGKPSIRSLLVVPEKYWALLPRTTRYKVKRSLKNTQTNVEYDDECMLMCLERARRFVV